MRVTVEYFGPAREVAGVGSEVIERHSSPHTPCAERSVQSLICQIAKERGGRFAMLLLTDDKLSRSLVLAVNDRQVSADEETELHDGDVVTIIPPVSGGA